MFCEPSLWNSLCCFNANYVKRFSHIILPKTGITYLKTVSFLAWHPFSQTGDILTSTGTETKSTHCNYKVQ